MITNLIASIVVTLVTNTTERFPQRFVEEPNRVTIEFGGLRAEPAVMRGRYEDDKDAKKKWITTTVKRITTIHFEWMGKKREVSDECVISSIEVECVLSRKEDWIPVSTNSAPRFVFDFK